MNVRAITSTPSTPPLTRWVHTGIDAPGTFAVQDFSMTKIHRGVAYSGKLVHPDHGVVGLVDNEGCGGPTSFHPFDRARYSEQDLYEFLALCRQDGQPMKTGEIGLEYLLDEIINEAEYAGDVITMRQEHHFLVRSFAPRTSTNYGSHRGPSLPFAQPRLSRADRARIAASLAGMPEHRLAPGESWQMFNGVDWVPLLGDPVITPEQTRQRLAAVDDLLTRPGSRSRFVLGERLDQQFFLFGSAITGVFNLIGDSTIVLQTTQWCRCPQRPDTVRFQHWDSGGIQGSGVVHAAKNCRRLVSID